MQIGARSCCSAATCRPSPSKDSLSHLSIRPRDKQCGISTLPGMPRQCDALYRETRIKKRRRRPLLCPNDSMRMGFQARVEGSCLSQTKQSLTSPTAHCKCIFIAEIKQKSEPRLCKQARICIRTYTNFFQLYYITLQPNKSSVDCRSPREPPLCISRLEEWEVSSPAA